MIIIKIYYLYIVKIFMKFFDYILNKVNSDNEPYQISVLEEILNHLEEDDYEIQSAVNKLIVDELRTESQTIKLLREIFS